MANYHLTHKAVEDITNIWGYLHNPEHSRPANLTLGERLFAGKQES